MPDSSERIGRYQLLEPIGGGPTGVVSRAKVFGVAGFERQFAIKRFHADLVAAPAIAQALSAAARAYGGLEHPRIARMSEFGVAQGQTFTAVELVAGLDVARLAADAKLGSAGLPAGGSLALVSQVARAVGYAHGRGLSHLGLSPSNVIVTTEGDVKVTDFGILAATMAAHPVESPRLGARIGYIAPEQLVGEATSAATDVYVLGVIAYELVTGQRAFFGDTPGAVAQAILAGPPADPPLPRPIVRVLTRCLARSPFERFPDARAFADALDAALRVAPVPGTRKEIGAQVKAALDRSAAMNDGSSSGMVSLNMITPPPLAPHGTSDEALATNQFVRPDTPVPRPPPLVGPKSPPPLRATLPELPKPMLVTQPGIVPPIPVPQGIAAPQPAPPIIPPASPAHTMLGLSPPKRAAARPPTMPTGVPTMIPSIMGARPAPKPPDPQQIPTATRPALDQRLASIAQQTPVIPDEPATAPYALIDDNEPVPIGPGESAPSIQVIGDAARAERSAPNRSAIASMSDGDALVELSLEPHVAPPSEATALERESESVFETPTRVSPLPVPREAMRSETVPPLSKPAAHDAADTDQHELSVDIDAPEIIELAEVPYDASPARRAPSPSPPSLVPSAPSPVPSAESLAPPPPVGGDLHMTTRGVSAGPRGPSGSAPVSSAPMSSAPVSSSPAAFAPIPSSAAPLAGYGDPQATSVPPAAAKPRRHWPIAVGVAIIVAGGGAVAAWQFLGTTTDETPPVASSGSAQTAKPATTAAATMPLHGSASASTSGSAVAAVVGSGAPPVPSGSAIAAISGSATPALTTPATGSGASKGVPTTDALAITSTPTGARVYIDGADEGVTPAKIAGTTDRHTLALLLPGHDLYVAEVDGHGAFSIPLSAVTPSGGPAGIKVIRCKDKNRYYVFVDGKATGMTCPTERIETTTGPHTVEVYDAVTETRHRWDITVADTRLSFRVRIE